MFSRGGDRPHESESDWDSESEAPTPRPRGRTATNDQTTGTGPQAGPQAGSSAEETPVRDVPKSKKTDKQNKGHDKKTDKKDNSDKQSKEKDVKHGSKTSAKSSRTHGSKKSPPIKRSLNEFTFTDHHGIDSDMEDIVPSRHRSPRGEDPPYDFRGALPKEMKQEAVPSRKTGVAHRGQLYEPNSASKTVHDEQEQDGTGSWDDSDEDQKMLAEVREGFKKNDGQPRQVIDDTPEPVDSPSPLPDSHGAPHDETQDGLSSDSHPIRKQGKSAGFGSKLSERFKLKTTSRKSQGERPSEGDTGLVIRESKVSKQRNRSSLDDQEERYVYYFEECHQEYYDTTKDGVPSVMGGLAFKSEKIFQRLWFEFFGAVRIVVGFVAIFVVELFKFVSRHIVYDIIVRMLSVVGDFMFKPLLSTLFNGFVQPVLVLLWNVMSGIKHAMTPLIDLLRMAVPPCVSLLRAFRLVEINWKNNNDTSEHKHVQQV